MKLIGFSVAIVLFLCSFLFFAGAVNAVTNVSACGQAINVAGGYYVLNRSINSSSTCLTIGANNVTLDCAYYGTQYNLTGTLAENTYGVYLTGKTNVTIKNCLITSFSDGVYARSNSNNCTFANNTANNNANNGFALDSSYNDSFVNNTANNNYAGFVLESSSNNVLANNTASDNDDGYGYGIGFWFSSSSNNSLANNTASNHGYAAVYFYEASNNLLANNTITKSSGQGGIYFSGDSYAHFQNYIDMTNVVNGLPAKYYDGVQTPCPNNTVLNLGSSYSFIGFAGCNNVTLTNTTANDGIWLSYTANSSVTNSNSSYSEMGFRLCSSSNNSFVNNTANANMEGFFLYSSSSNNSFVNNTANYNGDGFYLRSSSNNNSLVNNTANDNDYSGFYLESASSNVFNGNSVTTSGNWAAGFYPTSNSNYNNFSSNAVTTSGSTAFGFAFDSSTGNLVNDSVIDASYAGTADVYVAGDGINNLTNCSFNKSDTYFYNASEEGWGVDATGGINVFWYVDGRVTDLNGNGLTGAAINASNVNGTGVFNSTTNASGWIARRAVLEYWQNITGVYNKTPHWFNASLGAYSNNSQSPVSSNVVLSRALGLTRSATLDSPADGTTSTSYSQVFCFTPVTPGSPVNASVVVNGPNYYYSAVNSSVLVSGSQHCFNSVLLPLVGTYYWSVLFYDSFNYIQTSNFSLTVYNAFVGGGGGSTPTPTPTATATPTVTVTPSLEPSFTPIGEAGIPEGTFVPTPLTASPTTTPTVGSNATPSVSNGAAVASQASASNAISSASALMAQAKSKGVDSSEARNLLALAQQALQKGDYADAQRYAGQAESVLNSKISAAESASSSNAGFDWLLAGGVAVIVLVAGGVYWFYSRKR